jgi:5-(carboxyamino)imidazole ribonucleotide synthase
MTTIGILGGGQLGRMLAMAAARLGIDAHIYCPDENSPAARVSAQATVAAYDDETALAAFADGVDAITTEFENVPAGCARFLAARRPVHPSADALEIAQDRVSEKAFLNDAGIGTAPWRSVDTLDDLTASLEAIGPRGILKTRRLGYDGKGQARLDGPEDVASAFDDMNGAPAILEGLAAFEREISVIAARGTDGTVRCYDPGENRHSDGILRETRVPANIDAATRDEALSIAGRIVEALDYVGVIGVEMFAMPDGALLVNEIAPRVHNTGHWTIEGCAISQFEQHVRAVCGLPLGDPARHSDAVMTNLIGGDVDAVPALLAEAGAAVHLYGKGDARPGRKMGHVTRLTPRAFSANLGSP